MLLQISYRKEHFPQFDHNSYLFSSNIELLQLADYPFCGADIAMTTLTKLGGQLVGFKTTKLKINKRPWIWLWHTHVWTTCKHHQMRIPPGIEPKSDNKSEHASVSRLKEAHCPLGLQQDRSNTLWHLLPGGGKHSHEREIRVCPAVKTPFFKLSGRSSDPQLHFAPVLKTPVFSNSWFLTQKLAIFLTFAAPKTHFSPEFQLFTSTISLKLQLFIPYFCQKFVLLDPKFCASRRTRPFQSRVPPPGFTPPPPRHFLVT